MPSESVHEAACDTSKHVTEVDALQKAMAGSYSHIGTQEQVLHGGRSQVERVPAEPMRGCSGEEMSLAKEHHLCGRLSTACASQLLILAVKLKAFQPAAQI